MTKLIITYKDWVHCQVNGLTNEDLHKAYETFQVFNPTARFQPLYKMGRWNGMINFFGLTGVTYTNLLPELFSKINIKQYDIEEIFPEDILEDPDLGEPIDENYMSDLAWYEGHRLAGQPIILEEHQVRCINAMIYQHRGLLEAATGCHSKGTKILMFDGSWKNVEDIVVGDEIMGDDGTKRKVLNLHHGIDDMYEIKPIKDKSFIVNSGHILPVICNNKRKQDYNKVTYISVKDWLNTSKYYKHTHKIYSNHTEIDWNQNINHIIDPYIMGVYLGDGSTRSSMCSITSADDEIVQSLLEQANSLNMSISIKEDKRGNKSKQYTFIQNGRNNQINTELKRLKLFGHLSKDKFIPDEYKYDSIENRYKLLAGLIDTDGYADKGVHYYYTNSERLKDDVIFICGSLGIKTHVHLKKVKEYENNTYYVISICGKNNKIPTKLKRKQINKSSNKDNRRSGFSVKYIGKGEYFGFEVDNNNLYIMENWWVQHNSGKTLLSAALCRKVKPFGKVVLIVDGKDLCFQTADELNKFGCDAGVVGCGLREFGHDVSVCTWQTINSISKKSKDSLNKEELKTLVDGVVAMIFDEVHRCKGNEVKKVAEQVFSNVPIRWGLTGTIPKQKIDYYNLATAIGPVLDENVQAKELQDKGFLSNCQVNCIRLKDDYKFFTWDDEKEYLASNTDRLAFMASLISGIVQQQKNTLVLVDRIVTGETLEKMLIEKGVDAIFLQGSVKSAKRFEEYKKFANEDNKCVIAIDKIASTGLNIPRLFNIVFIDYGKAFTKTIQSIGRGLRRALDKDFVTIYDISSTTHYSREHFNNRIHYYEDAQYPYQVMNIDKWK